MAGFTGACKSHRLSNSPVENQVKERTDGMFPFCITSAPGENDLRDSAKDRIGEHA